MAVVPAGAGVGIGALMVAATQALGWCAAFALLYLWNGTFHRVIEATADRIEGIGIRGRFRPDIGLSPVANAIRSADNAVIQALEDWIRGAEIILAAFWEAVTDSFDWMGKEIADLADAMAGTVSTVTRQSIPDAERRAIDAAKRVSGAVARDLAHFTTVAIPGIYADISGLRGRIGTLRRDIARLGTRVRHNEKRLAAGAFAAATMVALRSMGLGKLRCGNVRKNLRRLCGMDPRVLDLFFVAALPIAFNLSLVKMTEDMLKQMDVFEAALRRGFKEL